MSQKLFKALGATHDFFKKNTWITKQVHQLLEKWAPTKTQENLAWDEEAESVLLEQMPLRAKKILYWISKLWIRLS